MRPFLNARAQGSRFWNPYTQTLPRAALNALHLRRLQAAVRYAYDHVPMYRTLYAAAGFRPEMVQTLDDFAEKVPVLDKKDLLAAQAVRPPFGEALALSEERLSQLWQTSGSTGVPLHIPIDEYSTVLYGECWCYIFWACGIRPHDRFFFAFNFGTFSGFWSAYYGVRRFGGTIVSGGGFDTKGRIRYILEIGPTVLFATPTYALYFGEVAKEMGVDLSRSALTHILLAGEPGGSIPTTRRAISEIWGAQVYELYGVGELGPIGPGCPTGEGVHVCEDYCYPLVVDEANRPVGDGQVGEVLITTFMQYAQPLIKYRTHDLVEVHRHPCACGTTWTYFKGGVLGRTDNMIIIRGTNIYPAAIEALLGRVTDLSENYEMHVDHDGRSDRVAVKVEAKRGVEASSYGSLQARLEEVLRENLLVRIGVEVLKPETLPRYELKAKRFFDHRPKDKQWQIQR